MVPLISNGESCWAQPPHTTAGGTSDGVSDIFTAVNVYVEHRRGGSCVLVSSLKVTMCRTFYIKCSYLYIPSALKDTNGAIKTFLSQSSYSFTFSSIITRCEEQQQPAVNGKLKC